MNRNSELIFFFVYLGVNPRKDCSQKLCDESVVSARLSIESSNLCSLRLTVSLTVSLTVDSTVSPNIEVMDASDKLNSTQLNSEFIFLRNIFL